MKRVRGLVTLLIVLALTGCGSHPRANLAHGVVKIRRGTTGSSLRHAVLGITLGTSASDVRQRLGTPFATLPSQGESCWAYHASQPGTAIDALDFCFDHGEKLVRILIGVQSTPSPGSR